MKFSVSIPAVFNGVDVSKAVDKVKELGITHVEFWGCPNQTFSIPILGFCTSEFNLVDPSMRDKFIDGLKDSIESAKDLGAKCLITQTGNDTGWPGQKENIIETLKLAAPLLEASGITLLLEPLNNRNHPGHYLQRSDEAFEIVKAVSSPNVKVLFDIYHQQITEGDILTNIRENIDLIGHFHVAGVPDRAEPYNSEINYAYVLSEIDKLNYSGFAGLEFFPTVDPVEAISETLKMLEGKFV